MSAIEKAEHSPLVSNPPVVSHRPLYGMLERVFRTAFLQFAVQKAGWIEQFLIYAYRSCSGCGCAPFFTDKKMDAGLERFRRLGCKETYVTPEDKQAHIHMLTFDPKDLETKIFALGGEWKRVGKQFAIICPEYPSDEWKTFQKDTLLHKTGWQLVAQTGEEKGSEPRDMIITCEDAEQIDPAKPRTFIHTHDRPEEFHAKRLGFYLGMKQNVVLYSWRGVRYSQGTPSEKGLYLDILAVTQELVRRGHKIEDLWVSGSCKSTYVAAYLKAKYHEQGINYIAEQAAPNLRDVIEEQPGLARWFAKWNFSALSARDIDKNCVPDVKEDGFSTEDKWAKLPKSAKGKVLIIHAKDDNTIPKDSADKYKKLAEQVNEQVKLVIFTDPQGHNIDSISKKEVRQEIVDFVFKR